MISGAPGKVLAIAVIAAVIAAGAVVVSSAATAHLRPSADKTHLGQRQGVMTTLPHATGLDLGAAYERLLVLPPSAAAKPRACATHDFEIREAPESQGAGGSFILILAYRDVSKYTCETGGWPGVTLYTREARALPGTRRSGSKGPRLRVKPGRAVYSKVQYSETPERGRSCKKVISARVFAPNSTQSSVVHLSDASAWCGGWITRASMGPSIATAQP